MLYRINERQSQSNRIAQEQHILVIAFFLNIELAVKEGGMDNPNQSVNRPAWAAYLETATSTKSRCSYVVV